MARASSPIRQRDLTRVVKALISAGLHVTGVKVDPQTGKIEVVTGKPEAQGSPTAGGGNEWDSV